MNCKLDKNLLYAYADKTIGNLEQIFVEEHLKYCEFCKKDLKLIHVIDKNLNTIEDDIIFPERLNIISQLVVENCLAETKEEDFKSSLRNLYNSYIDINNSIKKSQKLYKQNPFNKFIYNSINRSISYLEKPVKKYVKKKVKKISFLNLFNAG